MKSITPTISATIKLLLVATLAFVVLCTNVLSAKAASLVDIGRTLTTLERTLNQYKSGQVLGVTVTTVSTAAELTAALNAATGGETIMLNAGNYGAVTLTGKNYSALVTVTAATASNPPKFSSIAVTGGKNLKLDKIYVAFVPTAATTDNDSGVDIRNVDNFILSNSF